MHNETGRYHNVNSKNFHFGIGPIWHNRKFIPKLQKGTYTESLFVFSDYQSLLQILILLASHISRTNAFKINPFISNIATLAN